MQRVLALYKGLQIVNIYPFLVRLESKSKYDVNT